MYKIELTKPARKAYLNLPEKFRQKVSKKLTALAEAPMAKHHDVKRLSGMEKVYRLRIQDWRVVYRIEHNVSKRLANHMVAISH